MRSIIEGESLKLVMYIESFPVSMINLHSPDNLVHPLVCTIDQQVHSYTTHIEGLKCEEPGNYTIEANNGIGEATMSSFDLDIQCTLLYLMHAFYICYMYYSGENVCFLREFIGLSSNHSAELI